MICRCLPPYGQGIIAPCTVANSVRKNCALISKSCCSESVSLLIESCKMGTVLALYRRINGGTDPGGICRSAVCEIAVTCAVASSILAFG